MNIAEHIAYLIGDSKRLIIPIYSVVSPGVPAPQPSPSRPDISPDVIDDIVGDYRPRPEQDEGGPNFTRPPQQGPGSDIIPEGNIDIYWNIHKDPPVDDNGGGTVGDDPPIIIDDPDPPGDKELGEAEPFDSGGLRPVYPNQSTLRPVTPGDTSGYNLRPVVPGTVQGGTMGLPDDVKMDSTLPIIPNEKAGQGGNPVMQQQQYIDTATGQNVFSQREKRVSYIKKDVLERWIKDIIAKTSKLLPSNLKLHLTKSRIFTAGEWSSSIQQGVGYDLNYLDSSEIVSVSRYDGEIAYDCRQIPFHLRSKSRFGSGFLEECSETDPVYYVNDMKLMVEPKPEDTHLDALDGFCTIDYTCYPDIDVNWNNMVGVPFDMQQVILVGTAAKCKKFQLDSLATPALPMLNPNFKIPQLDNPLVMDAIDTAKGLIDNYSGNSFKDFLKNEDIEMAKTALAGSAKALEIAATELSEQDKISTIYLSEYSQNISKFSQTISRYNSSYKKLYNDYESLQNEYQELLYSFRGELPGKKQMGASEKKLAQIKQVVQR